MKTSLICGAALAILGLAAAPLFAQTQTATSSSSIGYVQTSKIIGTKVKTARGEEVGVVKDVVLDRSNGCMAYTVLSAGGTGARVTGQSKLVAVPWSVYSVSPDMSYLTVQVERDRIYNGPVFEYSRIGDPTFTSTVYSTWGVSAGVGVSTSTTTGATTTTDATTTTGTSAQFGASPGASPATSASPAMSPSASLGASVSARPAASPSATASATSAATVSASPGRATRTKAGASPGATSTRHKGGTELMQGTESPAESTGSPSRNGAKGSKKSAGAENPVDAISESAETGAGPSGKKSSHKKTSTEGANEAVPTPGGEQE